MSLINGNKILYAHKGLHGLYPNGICQIWEHGFFAGYLGKSSWTPGVRASAGSHSRGLLWHGVCSMQPDKRDRWACHTKKSRNADAPHTFVISRARTRWLLGSGIVAATLVWVWTLRRGHALTTDCYLCGLFRQASFVFQLYFNHFNPHFLIATTPPFHAVSLKPCRFCRRMPSSSIRLGSSG